MKRFFHDAFLAAFAILGVGAMMGTVFSSLSILKGPASSVAVRETEQQIQTSLASSGEPCVPDIDTSVSSVGGLAGVSVPGIPGMLRLDYDKSVYTVRQDEEGVLQYYLPKLASQCWTLTSLGTGVAEWEKGGVTLAMNVQENGLGQKATLAFAAGGNVRGIKVAQTECPSGQNYCPGTGCVAPGTPCTSSGSSGSYSSGCSSTEYYCAGTGCVPMSSSCPSASSGSSGSSGTSCGTPPSGCANGYTYTNGCATGCASAQQTSCTSAYAQNGSYSCNYSTCPSGCTYGSDGCPTACYTAPSCSGEYQQSGATSPMCNYSKCTNGCTWTNGCPSGCYTPAACTGEYQQTQGGTPTCNYSKCPSGCTYGGSGCPTGCYTSSGGSGCGSGYYWCNGSCVPNSSSCSGSGSGSGTYTSCSSDRYWCNGACIPMGTTCNGGGSGATTCPTGYYWCSATNNCKPNTDTNCTTTANPTTNSTNQMTQTTNPTTATACTGQYQRRGVESPSCDTNTCMYGCTFATNGCPNGCLSATDQECPAGQKWCSVTKTCKPATEACAAAKRVCDLGFFECSGTCIPEGTTCFATKSSCPTGQYLCNGSCTPTSNSCNGYQYPEPGKQQCGTGMYYCSMTKTCIPNASTCSTTTPKTEEPTPQPKPDMPVPPVQPGDDEARERKEEEVRQRIDEERLKQMKRNMAQFERGIKMMDRLVKRMEPRLAKSGVGIPAELKAALAKAPEVIAKIKDAKTPEELEDLMDDIQDIGDAMQEWGPKFGDLERLSKMLTQAARDLGNMKRGVDRVAKGVKKMPASEEIVTEIRALFDGMSAALTDAKTLAATDAEGALQKLEAEFYDRMEEFWNAVAEADMVQNLTRGISQGQSELRRAESRIRSLERTKKITKEVATELRDMLAVVKTNLIEVQRLSKVKGVDVDELRAAAETFWDSIREFEERMAELGQSFYQPVIGRGESFDFELPQAFDFRPLGAPEEAAPETATTEAAAGAAAQ